MQDKVKLLFEIMVELVVEDCSVKKLQENHVYMNMDLHVVSRADIVNLDSEEVDREYF